MNIEAAVSDCEEEKIYYIYNDSALNGIDRDCRDELAQTSFRLIATKSVKTKKLDKILDEQITAFPTANFLNVDVESYNLQVLRSNNWDRCPFAWVPAECERGDEPSLLKFDTYLDL